MSASIRVRPSFRRRSHRARCASARISGRLSKRYKVQSAHPRALLETDIKQKAQRDCPHWERQLWDNCGFASRAAKKEHGLRLPASASCLGRHSHPAGRCPNSSSLFRPLAALVAVALGCFCAVFSDVAAAVRIHPRLWPQRSYIRKTPVYFYTSVFLVERSNPNPNHCPLGHLWRRFHRK